MKSLLLKLNFLISKKQRKSLIILFCFILIGMVLEVFGLGIILPVISLIVDPNFLESNIYLKHIYEITGKIENYKLINVFLLIVLIIYFIKTTFLVFLTIKQNRFLSKLTAELSIKLFNNYLKQPYEFHLKRNSSELIKNIQVEISFFSIFSKSLLTVLTESFLLASIVITLIYIEPLGALTIGLFLLISSIIFFQFTKRKLTFWGIKREKLDNKVSKIIVEGLGGIKDLVILGRQKYVLNAFTKSNNTKAVINSNQAIIAQLPRYYLELLSVLALVGLIFILLFQNKDSSTIMTILGIFVAAVFRMIPSINKIISSYQNLKFYNSSIEILYNEAKLFVKSEPHSIKKINFNEKISIQNLSFKYKGTSKRVLKNINLTIYKGETIGIIGPSGSGKSTLIDLIIGLYKPSSGQITVDNISIMNNTRDWKKKIGYVGQSIFLMNSSIRDNIAFGLPENMIDDKAVKDSLIAAQLEDFVCSLPKGENTFVGERGVQLSGGQRQRIGIARALYYNAEVLVLDEATASLDSKTETDVMQSINFLKGRKTIIIIAHRISTLKECDAIYELDEGFLKKNDSNLF